MRCAATTGTILGIILSFVLSAEPARACAEGFPRYKVLSNFDVIVRVPAGQPLDGIRVAILDIDQKPRPPDTTVAEAFTDKDGRAIFRGLKPGRNFMLVKRGEIEGEIAELDVVETNGLTMVQLKWPRLRVFTAQRIAGTLLKAGIPGAPKMAEDRTLAKVDLTLTEASSGREMGSTSTDDQGKFAFPEMAPGLYAMHMKWNGIAGYILLAVDAKAQDAEPSIYSINPTDCGLGLGKRGG